MRPRGLLVRIWDMVGPLAPMAVAVLVVATLAPWGSARTTEASAPAARPHLVVAQAPAPPAGPFDATSLVVSLAGIVGSIAIQALRVKNDREKAALKAEVEKVRKWGDRVEAEKDALYLIARVEEAVGRQVDRVILALAGKVTRPQETVSVAGQGDAPGASAENG